MTATGKGKSQDILWVKRRGGQSSLNQGQRATFLGLGLGRTGREVLLEDTNATRGMVNKVIHWVDVKLIPAKDSEKSWAAMAEKKKPGKKSYRVIKKSKSA